MERDARPVDDVTRPVRPGTRSGTAGRRRDPHPGVWHARRVGGDPVAEFVAQRGRLFGLAYRMLGSATDAEDVVQESYLRWSRADHAVIDAPGAWLAKTVTNLCISALTSARARRESYVGPWLPEPVLTEDGELGPAEHAQRTDTVSLALLATLERLTPTERAVFVLREAFDYDHETIAGVVGTSPANSRQLHSRARRKLRDPERPGSPRTVDAGQVSRLLERFVAAARDGDLARLEAMLAADVVSRSDGGGQVSAARRPILGAVRVARLFAGLARQAGDGVTIGVRGVNGAPALVIEGAGQLVVIAVEVVDGRIAEVDAVVNPEKLSYLRHQLSQNGPPSGPS
jgi:RNA polymerase sigma-70 factor (TIGR02957 family)